METPYKTQKVLLERDINTMSKGNTESKFY